MKPPRTKPSLVFRLIVPVTSIFILTIMALIATVFGDPDAPVSKWLDRYGNQLLIWEFIFVVVLTFLAMAIDRVRTLQGKDEVALEHDDIQPPDGENDKLSSSTPLRQKS